MRHRVPQVRICLRAGNGLCLDDWRIWWQAHWVKRPIGLARNPMLKRKLAPLLGEAECASMAEGGAPARVPVGLNYPTTGFRTPFWMISKPRWTKAGNSSGPWKKPEKVV